MKPTIASANRWIARKALLQARQKRFLRAAAVLHWPRFVGVLGALWVLHQVIGTTPLQIWARVIYVLIALGYLWMDVHYRAKALKRRSEWKDMCRKHLQVMREFSDQP